jgi:hypothetical protein
MLLKTGPVLIILATTSGLSTAAAEQVKSPVGWRMSCKAKRDMVAKT